MTKQRAAIAVRVQAAVLLALAGTIAGCDNSDPVAAAVTDADIKLTSLDAGGTSYETVDAYAQAVYSQVSGELQQYATGDGGYTDAASVLLAQAKLGQAADAAATATELQIESVHKIRVIRGYVSEWLGLTTVADAISSHDSTDELAEIDAQIAAMNEAIRTRTAEKQAIDSELADLDAQVAQLQAEAQQHRNTAGEYKLQLTTATAVEGVELSELIRASTRRADRLEIEAAKIQTTRDSRAPVSVEAGLRIREVEQQLAMLEKSMSEINERDARAKANAASARADAAAAAEEIASRVRALNAFRADEMTPAIESAAGTLRDASSTAGRARADAAESSNLVKGAASQTIAGLHRRLAAEAALAAQLFESIDEMGIPGLDYASFAAAARAAEAEALDAAKEAYDAAAIAYRSVRVRGEVGDRLAQVADRLAQLGTEPPAAEDIFSSDSVDAEDDSYDDEDESDDDYDDSDL